MKDQATAPTNEFYDAEGQLLKINRVRQVANKTFYFKNNEWVDNDYTTDQKPIQVKRFSEAYFQLGRAVPVMNQYLALGHDVIITIGKQSFQVGDSGRERFTEEELRQIF
jgi:hypothetical protein